MFTWLKNLFAASAPAGPRFEPEEYKGFTIIPEPGAEGGQYRLQGRILQERDGEPREYRLIRADLLPTAEQAAELMVSKAKRLIDENGERLFD
ncbi:transcriptional activator HlyU [Oceanimonas sp. GK1]|uniref:HlyU family transcriptional regulator n=1 Tax=Oceanimonas sp. (strain GK1 / IBRC-M 10197) TaxID=511062 RepID=UPI0002495491|nr:HlyU family transcriptional regulator [Oceanimonas sp. GK1]AEY02452.1 transcriptional activator HlyU [Oceanimonas sp. GK1]